MFCIWIGPSVQLKRSLQANTGRIKIIKNKVFLVWIRTRKIMFIIFRDFRTSVIQWLDEKKSRNFIWTYHCLDWVPQRVIKTKTMILKIILNRIQFHWGIQNQVHNCRFELLNKVRLPVLSALILYRRPFWSENRPMWQPYLSYKRSWPISGGQIITPLKSFPFSSSHYELVCNFLWNSKDFYNGFELY